MTEEEIGSQAAEFAKSETAQAFNSLGMDADYYARGVQELCEHKSTPGNKKPSTADMYIRKAGLDQFAKSCGYYAPDKHIFPDKHGEPQDIAGLSNLEMATKLLNVLIQRKEEAEADAASSANSE